ncbi:hypothetical protein BDR03DRAFT_941173 [Suillus americanus]|nr:hypothetical protein BDR03DRAFT_941173 [Suillus americanus]
MRMKNRSSPCLPRATDESPCNETSNYNRGGCPKTYIFLGNVVYHCNPALIFLWITFVNTTCPFLVSAKEPKIKTPKGIAAKDNREFMVPSAQLFQCIVQSFNQR